MTNKLEGGVPLQGVDSVDDNSREKKSTMSGQEYYEKEKEKRDLYTIVKEGDKAVEIVIKHGLLDKVIAAAVAVETGKQVQYNGRFKQQFADRGTGKKEVPGTRKWVVDIMNLSTAENILKQNI